MEHAGCRDRCFKYVRIYSTIPNAADVRESTSGYMEPGMGATFSFGAAEGAGHSSFQRARNGGSFGVRGHVSNSLELEILFLLKHGSKSIKVNARQI